MRFPFQSLVSSCSFPYLPSSSIRLPSFWIWFLPVPLPLPQVQRSLHPLDLLYSFLQNRPLQLPGALYFLSLQLQLLFLLPFSTPSPLPYIHFLSFCSFF